MCWNQTKRFNKLKTDAFYLLNRENTTQNLKFHISGSTKNIYTVVIDKKSNSIDCDCPDGKYASKNLNVKCKHCLFVLVRVLRLFKDCTDDFFTTLKFSPSQLESIVEKYDQLDKRLDESLIDINLTKKFEQIKNNTTPEPSQPTVKPDSCCGVCFDDLIPEKASEYEFCDRCGNAAHTDCVKAWMRQHDTCMYCRVKVSKNNVKTGQYDNLSAF